MGKPKSKHCRKWDIKNHVVDRFRTRVDEKIPRGTATEIRRMLVRALNDVPEDVILKEGSDLFYPIHFKYKGRESGPYYCIATYIVPRSIWTLLTEEQFIEDWQKRGGNLEDLYEETRME